jgi:hypothetical protein
MMINNSTNINKRTITSHLNSLNKKKTTVYGVGNPDSGLGQTYRYDGVKPVNGIHPPFFYNWISNDITYIKCDLKGYYKCITLYSLYKK